MSEKDSMRYLYKDDPENHPEAVFQKYKIKKHPK